MDLEARFERLEREVRLWRRFSILMAVVGALALLVAAGPKRSRVVTAERFELVGPDGGKPVGSWQVLKNGPLLSMHGADGDGAAIGISDENSDLEKRSHVKVYGARGSNPVQLDSNGKAGRLVMLPLDKANYGIEISHSAATAEVTLTQDGSPRAQLVADSSRSYLRVKAKGGVPNLFTSPQ